MYFENKIRCFKIGEIPAEITKKWFSCHHNKNNQIGEFAKILALLKSKQNTKVRSPIIIKIESLLSN